MTIYEREGDSGEIVDNLHADLEVIKSLGIVNTKKIRGRGKIGWNVF
jgi:hypothetical protein